MDIYSNCDGVGPCRARVVWQVAGGRRAGGSQAADKDNMSDRVNDDFDDVF